MIHTLSSRQRAAIRQIVEEGNADYIHRSTLESLARRGYLVKDYAPSIPNKVIVKGYYVTKKAHEEVRRYVDKTGDGPEALKEMFRI